MPAASSSRWDVSGQIERLNNLMAAASPLDPQSMEACRALFKALLEIYPSSNALWYAFAQWEFRCGESGELERIFSSSLKTNYDVRLWRLYIGYVKSSRAASQQEKPPSTADQTTAETRQTIIRAFELALGHVGSDLYALPIWKEYIDYCRSLTSTNVYEQQQLMDQTRRIYARALVVPLMGIETLWHEYDQYENALNKITAKKMLADKSAAYMLARATLKELSDFYAACDRSTLPLPPSIDGPTLAAHKLSQWMKWIEWEKGNPLKFSTDQVSNPCHQRIIFAYRVALTQLRHYPEVWFEYARFMLETLKAPEAAETILQQACSAIPDSLMVAFALADLYEGSKRLEQAKECYEGLLERLDGLCKAVLEDHPSEDEQSKESTAFIVASQSASIDGANNAKLFNDTTLAYLQFMQFSRRTEGILAARAVFARARKHAHLNYHIWVAAARMEYHCKRDTVVAGKIFELGMNKYGVEVEFVKEYLEFLIQTNDDQSIHRYLKTFSTTVHCLDTRSLFERALQLIDPAQSLDIWRLYLDYEYKYGEHQTVKSLEQRLKSTFPNSTLGSITFQTSYYLGPHSNEIDLFTRRFTYGDLYPSDDRAWLLVQPGALQEQSEVKRSTGRAQPFFLSDSIVDLVFRLPTASAFKGPLLNTHRLVSTLLALRPIGGDAGAYPSPTQALAASSHTLPPTHEPVALGRHSDRRTAVGKEKSPRKNSSSRRHQDDNHRRKRSRERRSRRDSENSPLPRRHHRTDSPDQQTSAATDKSTDLLEQRFNERIKIAGANNN